jgi:hypothetical protein
MEFSCLQCSGIKNKTQYTSVKKFTLIYIAKKMRHNRPNQRPFVDPPSDRHVLRGMAVGKIAGPAALRAGKLPSQ